MEKTTSKQTYIIHASDLASFDRETSYRRACQYARSIARDHGGCCVYAAIPESVEHGDLLARWDGDGRRLCVG